MTLILRIQETKDPTSLLKLDGREAERKRNLGQIVSFYT